MKRILHHVLFLFCYIIIFSCSSPFERQHTYDVSVSSLVGGKVVVNGSQFQIGQEVGISILPDIGYKILEGSLHYTKNGKKFAIPAGQFSMPAASIVISCEFVSKYETILTLDKTNATFIGNMTLTAKITTNAPTTPKLIWSSSDPAAIRVDNEQQRFVHHPDGTVSVTVDIIVGIQNKSAVITATTDTGKIEARCTVLELEKDIFTFVQSGDTNNPYTITRVNKLVRNDEETFYFPDVIDGKPVTKIGNGSENVFKDFLQHEVRIYKNIFIPASVKNIAIGTFSLFDRVETINVYAKNPPDIGNMKEVFNTANLKEIYVGGDPNEYRVKWALYKRYIIGFGQNKITISDKIAIEGGGRIEVESVTATPGNIVKLIVMADDDKELDLSPTGGVYASFVKPGTSETETWVFYNPYFVMPSADVTLYVKFIKRVEGVTMTPESYFYKKDSIETEVCNFRTYYKDGDQTTVILDVFNTTRDAPTVVVPGYDINAVAVKDTTTGNAIIGGVTPIPLPSDLPDDQKLFARYEIKKLRTALITVTVTWKKLTTIVTLYESKEARRGKIGGTDGILGTVDIEYGTSNGNESIVDWVSGIPAKFDKKSLLGFELAEGSVPVAERKLYFTYSQGENSEGKIKLALTDGWTINEKEIKLYAKWLGKSFSVEFYPDVSSSVSKAIELEYDKPITAEKLAMITGAGDFNTLKRGYDFLGFYTSNVAGDNKGERAKAPSSAPYFTNKASGANGDITLVDSTWGNNADSTAEPPTKLYGFWIESVWDGERDASPGKEPKVNGEGVYEIWRPSEFVSLAKRATLLGGQFKQMKDLKFDYTTISEQHGKSMIPVGENNTFHGTYDGNGHTIRNLKIDSTLDVVGLFGKLAGTLQNITIESGTITSNTASAIVGGIVGKVTSDAQVISCVNKATITSTKTAAAIGGVIGDSSSLKELSALGNEGTITSTVASSNVGGIIGKVSNASQLTIKTSYNIGNIDIGGASGSGGSNIGGLIGIVELSGSISIKQSYNIGSVIAEYAANVGGLVGQDNKSNDGSISFEDVYACAPSVKGNTYVSGLIGVGKRGKDALTPAITVENAYLFSLLATPSGASNALSQVAYISGAAITDVKVTKLYVSNTKNSGIQFNGADFGIVITDDTKYKASDTDITSSTANPFTGAAANWEYVTGLSSASFPARWVLKGVGPADSTKR